MENKANQNTPHSTILSVRLDTFEQLPTGEMTKKVASEESIVRVVQGSSRDDAIEKAREILKEMEQKWRN